MLSVVIQILLLLGGDELTWQVDPEFQDTAMRTMRVGVYFGIELTVHDAVTVLIHALFTFWAFRMRAGRNWARIVLAALGVVLVLLGATGPELTFDAADLGHTIAMLGFGGLAWAIAAVSLIFYAVMVAAIVFMYLPGARGWFARSAPTG